MSEQSQSNVQAFGAGLLGFAVVMAVGGGALMVHNSSQSKAAKPAPAAEPIDIGAPVIPRFESTPSRPQSERRAESPAPLIGDDEAEAAESAPAQSAAASQSSSSPQAASAESPRLKTVAHLETGGSPTATEAVVKNTIVEEKEEPVAKPKAPVKKLPVKLPQATGAEVASVHYGVTNRSELMGRAAGPVYNIKGGGAVGGSAPKGKMAEDLNSKVADLKKQLDGSGLPPEARDKLLKDLAEAQKAVPNTASAQ